jgi:tRNA (uracil-5-)-methyltransferase TRM9
MQLATQQRLLELNRHFYASVAREFDRSRAGLPVGWQQLTAWLPASNQPLRVLDAGCGNGRLTRWLEAQARPVEYVGVDGDASLLAYAASNTRALTYVRTSFQQVDLTQPDWALAIHPATQAPLAFELVTCFAVLHHLPGYALRRALLRSLAGLLTPGGTLMLSNWQFLTSARFAQKQIDWQTVGLSRAEVEQELEPGDALLPWQQGGYAVRYVHQVDAAELAQLAQAAGLQVVHSFYADGKEGKLNLYAVLRV